MPEVARREIVNVALSEEEARQQGQLQRAPLVGYRQQYRITCLPDQEWMRAYKEQLRYKWCYSKLALSRHTMQQIGNRGRTSEVILPLLVSFLALFMTSYGPFFIRLSAASFGVLFLVLAIKFTDWLEVWPFVVGILSARKRSKHT